MDTSPHHKQPVVLQILPNLGTGGVERGTVEVARAIVQAGWRAIVVSNGGQLVAHLQQVGAEHMLMPVHSKNPLRILLNSWRLARLVRAEKVDIIHARSRAPAWSAWLAARKTGARFVTTFHGVYGLTPKWKKYYNAIMVRGERVIAISEFIALHIRAHYGVPGQKVRIIHRGVDLKLFNPYQVSSERMIRLAKEWRLPDDMPILLFPGRITRWKGQHVFLEALANLPHRNFFAVFLGDDEYAHSEYRKFLECEIQRLRLEGHVRILPSTQYMTEAYMIAKCVISTSIEPEAFGRVILEAQAMGKPVIASSHGGACETVLHGQTGLLIEPGSSVRLSEAIQRVLTLDQETLDKIGENAIHHARQFSSTQMCEKTLLVYGELLQSPLKAGIRTASSPTAASPARSAPPTS